jgi:multiple sugar transport system permease protein
MTRTIPWIRRIWEARAAYAFLLPAYAFFLAFTLIPLFQGLYFSFFKVKLTGLTFVGVKHFVRLGHDEIFRYALLNTFLFVVIVVPLALALSLSIAVLVFPLRKRWQTFVRLAFYLPVVASAVVLSAVWLWIFNPTGGGWLNYLLGPLGRALDTGAVAWLETYALPSLCVVVLSWTIGQPVILFLAALGGIPPELHEAARIDGATEWQRFWRVTLPLLKPTTLFVLVTQTIGVFQVFVVVLLMTQGGPANATQTIVYQIYEKAFTSPYDFGYASAMATVLVVLVGTVAFLQFKFFGAEVEY